METSLNQNDAVAIRERARPGRSQPRPRGWLEMSDRPHSLVFSHAPKFGARARRTAAGAAALPTLSTASFRPKPSPHSALRTPLYGRNLPLVGPTCGRPRPTIQTAEDAPSASLPVAIIPLADGFGFVGSLANRVKSHTDYAVADGNILGLEGPEIQEPDATTTKPALKLVIVTGGKVEVQWKKSGFTGVRIEVDRGNGTWVFLDIDTKPHYTDETRPATGTTVLWKYRAIYLKGDQVFGQWSDVVSIAVTG